ncbi:MAG: metallophosphoesterase [Bacteroidales bacterium]|jgi:hypothetical protein|nr:metallophosphoesterase [Bacteroidales bacterium]
MKRLFIILLVSLNACLFLEGQGSSLIILGDLHYDLLADHDMNWLREKPGDLKQIEGYTKYTEENWSDFMEIIKTKAEFSDPPVQAIVQLGDLSEGLAGTPEKALQMASNTMNAVEETGIQVPWILTKGNHDITGPGAKEAFQRHYIPMIRKQTGNPLINKASYTYTNNNVSITCLDPWDKETDMLAFLEKELSESDAAYKIVAVHEPIIPVTERCWHLFRQDEKKREQILQLIAKHKAIILCGHLHRYSIVRRKTSYGPVVQIMVVSVVQDRAYQQAEKVIDTYGPSLAENVPDWQSETLLSRKKMLTEESKFVDYYKQSDLPGYAIIKMDSEQQLFLLEYYAAFSDKPYETIDLNKLISDSLIIN